MQSKMTDHEGVYFRSRLEARWCQFFQCLGFRFKYEPESIKTSLGWYVPDFYFRSLKIWVEIKGKRPTPSELQKLKEVCLKTNRSGFIISGFPKCYPNGVEPHLANCSCYFITNKGKEIPMSADEIYQATNNPMIFSLLEKCKPSSIVGFNPAEYVRYRDIKPSMAIFKPNKHNIKTEVKRLCGIFKRINERAK